MGNPGTLRFLRRIASGGITALPINGTRCAYFPGRRKNVISSLLMCRCRSRGCLLIMGTTGVRGS